MKSIAIKLWTGMMMLIVVVLILLWSFQIVFLQGFYSKMKISDVKRQGTSIIKLLGEGNKNKFEKGAEVFAFNNNLSIELVDLQGNSLFTIGASGPGGQMPMMRNNARIEAFQQVLGGKEITIPLTHPRFGNKFMLIGIPYKVKEVISGVFLINMPMAPVEDTVSILKRQLIYISLILLAAAILISFLLSKTFTKSILEIKKVSEKMASGDFTERIRRRSRDEIGDLAETINYMGEELSKIEELRKDLIANVSHELRTPLSLIRGYAETIRDVTGNNPEKRDKQLGIIVEESERLGRIVEDILNLSQLQGGYIALNKERFIVDKTIDKVLKRYEIIAEKNGIKIASDVSRGVEVSGDEAKIEQVLFNLMNNSINHTPRGGSIAIRTSNFFDYVRIEVSDTGTGIPDGEIPHVWERYYKGEKDGERKIIGSGLGLAIVKGILEAHQIKYGVESQFGLGTTFWFELKSYVKEILLE